MAQIVTSAGAYRDSEEGKLDYEGFLSPLVLERYAQYLEAHRKREDGTVIASDNWQQGIEPERYKRSFIRHAIDLWKAWRTGQDELIDDLICACIFNLFGLLLERLHAKSQREIQFAQARQAQAALGSHGFSGIFRS